MPFTKIVTGKDKGKYRSEHGKIYTADQVKLYYASDGFNKRKLAFLKRNKNKTA